MQLAEFDCGFEVRLNVVLAPIELPQDGMSIDGFRLRGQMFLENGNAFVEFSLFHKLRPLYDRGIGGPPNLVFNDGVCLVLQACASDDQGSYSSEDESSDVRPVCYARSLAK